VLLQFFGGHPGVLADIFSVGLGTDLPHQRRIKVLIEPVIARTFALLPCCHRTSTVARIQALRVYPLAAMAARILFFLSSAFQAYTRAPVDAFAQLGTLYSGGVKMRICELIKAQETYQVELGQTVLDTVRAMVERNIGAVPVLHNNKVVGIFSERDLMRRVVAEGRDPRSTCMAEVMTDDPLTINMNEDLDTCMALMRRHSFRHLPVCHEGQLVGMVSLRDILLHDLDEKDDEVRMMRAYIHSMPDA
jgi:CBS domain-containing protein